MCLSLSSTGCLSNGFNPCPFDGDNHKCDVLWDRVKRDFRAWKLEINRLNDKRFQEANEPSTQSNDGLDTCRWCGESTKVLVMFSSATRVCPVCKK